MRLTRLILCAALVFAALFALRLAYVFNADMNSASPDGYVETARFDYSTKNYAGQKQPSTPNLAGAERYEKIASLGQRTHEFEADRRKILSAIEEFRGAVQYERAQGLRGRQRLDLGIGVPPQHFDDFIARNRTIGTLTLFSIVKNDKTNEYQQLRAKRLSLEKALGAIEELRKLQASVDERLKVEARFNEIESEIQALGIALGDFDSQNELYTVKLTLQEVGRVRAAPWQKRAFDAFSWAASVYAYLGVGLLALSGALALGGLALRGLVRGWRELQDAVEARSRNMPRQAGAQGSGDAA